MDFLKKHYEKIILGGVLAIAMTGSLGGSPDHPRSRTGTSGTITLSAPTTLRNGEIFEISADLSAPRNIDQPVFAMSAELLRHLTFNTMTPEPTGQAYADGMVEFQFEPLAAQEVLHFRMSGQSNPTLRGGNQGIVQFRNAERELVTMPLRIRILP